ncbi:Putative phage regulatory protein [Pseudomonas brassicacearum subsp. brassicacearum NFM421]|uniref:Putative phage regulatory protein n=1 Tax=Pseudomonas brassicacearum (strain NFM421) TaxID=994484 RepID=F2KJI3_PSEBN|nr:BRO family protein [Pseudomonas brassicacearum]AEA70209.1 Putative phage regulatory protein [Pseudomonas brassicacearum subsp. brassicacearum NFM421]
MQSQPNSSNTPNNDATRFNKSQNVSRTNSVIPFDFDGGAIRVITDELGDPWFVARDVADALGYAKPENAISRHCKAATTTPKQGGGFMTVIPERDVYRLVMRSKLVGAERFEEWVVGEVLPSIRKTGKFDAASPSSSKVVGELALMECYTRLLKPSPSSQVMMLAKIATNNGLDAKFLPGYAVDAAPDAAGGSSMPTKSVTALLKDNGIRYAPAAFNNSMARLGFLKQLQRQNSKGEMVPFWSVTEKGLQYGKNLTSPQCPRETQPHWYVDRFLELAAKVGKA